MSWNRNAKNQIRAFAMKHGTGLGRVASTAFFLPGSEKRCVKKALAPKYNLVNRNTFIIAAERDNEVADSVEDFLSENFNNFYLHRGPLDTLDLRQYPKIDFGFIDCCGELTARIAAWLEVMSKDAFTDDARVSFTFKAVPRNHPFLDAVMWNLDKMHDVCELSSMKWNPLKDNGWNKYPIVDATRYALAASCSSGFRIKYGVEYGDKTPMVFFSAVKDHNVVSASVFPTISFNKPELKFDTKQKEILAMVEVSTVKEIVERFQSAGKNVHKLAGAKRMATCYVQRKVREGGDEKRIRAAVRANLTRNAVKTDW